MRRLDTDLAAWCRRRLGAGPVEVLFQAGHLSAVTGLRLADGRRVVVKVRPPAGRLAGWAAGLWVRAFNAKKERLGGDGGPQLERLAGEVVERARRAGVGPP